MTKLVDKHLINGKFLNVFTSVFEETELWIDGDKIVRRGHSDALTASETVDLAGQYVTPGLIDAHVHVESSLLAPSEFSRLLLSRGVTRVFADPNEIASVAGISGLQYMIDEARQSALHFHFMLPSSVPATPFEHAGAVLHAQHLKPFYEYPEVHGLAEVMDFPAVANGDADMMAKIHDAQAAGRHVDGHGAGLTREQLAIYRAVGIDTGHESDSAEAALERLDAGMAIFIREGTVERDEVAILPIVTALNQQYFSFATDDKTAVDIQKEGSIDFNVNLAVAQGLPMTLALKLASYNAAQAHHLQNVGALTDGYAADLAIFDDLNHFTAKRVLVGGEWVDDDPKANVVLPLANQALNFEMSLANFTVPMTQTRAHVIEIVPHHITTHHLVMDVPVEDGQFVANEEFAKIAVVERYHKLGHGLGIIKGFQLKQGAIAGTIAHDSHNLVVAGVDDTAMLLAVNTLKEIGGGLVVVDGQHQVTAVPLAIGGLMSDQPYEELIVQMNALQAAFNTISDAVFDPFITLSFMALPVIPSLKITDQGLFDFETFSFIDLEAK